MGNVLAKRNGAVAKHAAKTPPKQADWAICDISGSMGSHITGGTGPRRIECLNNALKELGDDVQVIAFSTKISKERIGEFSAWGDTYICPALREVSQHEPSYIVIISDGQITDSQSEALGLVDKIAQTAIIDTIYIGPEDSRAEAFMRDVATAGHGRFRRYEASKLEGEMQRLLPTPDEAIKI